MLSSKIDDGHEDYSSPKRWRQESLSENKNLLEKITKVLIEKETIEKKSLRN